MSNWTRAKSTTPLAWALCMRINLGKESYAVVVVVGTAAATLFGCLFGKNLGHDDTFINVCGLCSMRVIRISWQKRQRRTKRKKYWATLVKRVDTKWERNNFHANERQIKKNVASRIRPNYCPKSSFSNNKMRLRIELQTITWNMPKISMKIVVQAPKRSHDMQEIIKKEERAGFIGKKKTIKWSNPRTNLFLGKLNRLDFF